MKFFCYCQGDPFNPHNRQSEQISVFVAKMKLLQIVILFVPPYSINA